MDLVVGGGGSRRPEAPATRGTGSPTRECSLGLAEWAAPGSPSQGLGRLWPWSRFGCFAPGLGSPQFPIDLAPTKTGNIPREEEGTCRASAGLWESRITREN